MASNIIVTAISLGVLIGLFLFWWIGSLDDRS
jgi:nitrogen fixation-related uncharacterized protein